MLPCSEGACGENPARSSPAGIAGGAAPGVGAWAFSISCMIAAVAEGAPSRILWRISGGTSSKKASRQEVKSNMNLSCTASKRGSNIACGGRPVSTHIWYTTCASAAEAQELANTWHAEAQKSAASITSMSDACANLAICAGDMLPGSDMLMAAAGRCTRTHYTGKLSRWLAAIARSAMGCASSLPAFGPFCKSISYLVCWLVNLWVAWWVGKFGSWWSLACAAASMSLYFCAGSLRVASPATPAIKSRCQFGRRKCATATRTFPARKLRFKPKATFQALRPAGDWPGDPPTNHASTSQPTMAAANQPRKRLTHKQPTDHKWTIHQPANKPTHQSTEQPINQATHPSTNHLACQINKCATPSSQAIFQA